MAINVGLLGLGNQAPVQNDMLSSMAAVSNYVQQQQAIRKQKADQERQQEEQTALRGELQLSVVTAPDGSRFIDYQRARSNLLERGQIGAANILDERLSADRKAQEETAFNAAKIQNLNATAGFTGAKTDGTLIANAGTATSVGGAASPGQIKAIGAYVPGVGNLLDAGAADPRAAAATGIATAAPNTQATTATSRRNEDAGNVAAMTIAREAAADRAAAAAQQREFLASQSALDRQAAAERAAIAAAGKANSRPELSRPAEARAAVLTQDVDAYNNVRSLATGALQAVKDYPDITSSWYSTVGLAADNAKALVGNETARARLAAYRQLNLAVNNSVVAAVKPLKPASNSDVAMMQAVNKLGGLGPAGVAKRLEFNRDTADLGKFRAALELKWNATQGKVGMLDASGQSFEEFYEKTAAPQIQAIRRKYTPGYAAQPAPAAPARTATNPSGKAPALSPEAQAYLRSIGK